MTFEAEAALLEPHIELAKQGGVVMMPPLKVQIETVLGHSMALSTVYAMLHRHGGRELAPDKQHTQSDPVAQELRHAHNFLDDNCVRFCPYLF